MRAVARALDLFPTVEQLLEFALRFRDGLTELFPVVSLDTDEAKLVDV